MLNRQNGREEQIRVTYIIRSLGMPLPQHLSIERPVLRPGKHPVHFSGVSSYWRTSILRSSQNPVIVESPHTALLCSTIHSGFQRRTVFATIQYYKQVKGRVAIALYQGDHSLAPLITSTEF